MTVSKAMALMLSVLVACLTLAVHVSAVTPGNALSPTYYDGLCGFDGTKKFQDITARVVTPLVIADPTLIPALLRTCFHDSFVRGSDASFLLDDSPGLPPVEKDGLANANSLRGFEVFDKVKTELEKVCPRVYSCADIVQETVRVAMKTLLFGSLQYYIMYGRRDGNVSRASEADSNLPPPFFKYKQLVANFAAKGFNATEMATLSGAHSVGVAHCRAVTPRLYNFSGDGTGTDPAMDTGFAEVLKLLCPKTGSGNNIVPLNIARPVITIPVFDNQYYKNVQDRKGLFTSDSALRDGDRATVDLYAADNKKFRADFTKALVKMTELQVTLFPAGEIRSNCRKRN